MLGERVEPPEPRELLDGVVVVRVPEVVALAMCRALDDLVRVVPAQWRESRMVGLVRMLRELLGEAVLAQ